MKYIRIYFLGLLLAALLLWRFVPTSQPEPHAATANAKGPNKIPAVAIATPSAESTSSGEWAPQESSPENSWLKQLRELRELAAEDPEAALAEISEMPDKHERKTAAAAVCVIVAKRDPAKAMTTAWNLDLGKFCDESTENAALENLATQWAETDLVKAFVWASALPADDEARRDRVMKGIALTLANVAPAEAAAMIAKHIDPDSAVHADAAIEVLRTWATQEYAGALQWASLFPAGPLRERSIEELASVAQNGRRTE